MKIRNIRIQDRPELEKICLGTSPTNNSAEWNEAILTCFCNYYVNEEPQNCFVAVNENNKIVGYVLCAMNFETWQKVFTEKFIIPSKNPIAVQMANGTIKCLQPLSKDYPAHLHIDISSDYQGQGIGTMLLDTLKEHLRNMKISGLALDVAADNEGAIRFYKRNGFQLLSVSNQECVMGCIL